MSGVPAFSLGVSYRRLFSVGLLRRMLSVERLCLHVRV